MEANTVKYYSRLDGCPNFRDIGGYNVIGGGVTSKNKFYRSDCLSKLTETDIDKLINLGIGCVVDLRHYDELEKKPNPLANNSNFKYYNVSLSDAVKSVDLIKSLPESIPKMYNCLIHEAGKEIVTILKIFTQNKDKGIVFHCTAGKDRTGIISALLLMIAGVDMSDIIYDYSKTYGFMKDIFTNQIEEAKSFGYTFPKHILLSESTYIEELIDCILTTHNGVNEYLELNGMKTYEILELKNHILF